LVIFSGSGIIRFRRSSDFGSFVASWLTYEVLGILGGAAGKTIDYYGDIRLPEQRAMELFRNSSLMH